MLQLLKTRNVAAPKENETSMTAHPMYKITLSDGTLSCNGLAIDELNKLKFQIVIFWILKKYKFLRRWINIVWTHRQAPRSCLKDKLKSNQTYWYWTIKIVKYLVDTWNIWSQNGNNRKYEIFLGLIPFKTNNLTENKGVGTTCKSFYFWHGSASMGSIRFPSNKSG